MSVISERIAEEALNVDVAVARKLVMDAIVARDSAKLVEALSLYGAVSWTAGWDACAEEYNQQSQGSEIKRLQYIEQLAVNVVAATQPTDLDDALAALDDAIGGLDG